MWFVPKSRRPQHWCGLLLALCLAPNWAAPAKEQPKSPRDSNAHINANLLRIERQRQHLQGLVLENLENQFTVGYKANVPLPEDDRESALDMTEGPVVLTRVATHLAILGRGFFQLEDGSYTRDGRFALSDGTLQTTTTTKRAVLGFPLDAQGNINGNPGPFKLSFDEKLKLYQGRFSKLGIDNTGRLYGIEVSSDTVSLQSVEKSTPLFQFGLVDFDSPQYMRRIDATRLRSTPRAGKNYVGFAGQGNLGEVAAGFVELSNVNFKEQSYWLGWLEKGRFEPPFPSADERMQRAAPFNKK